MKYFFALDTKQKRHIIVAEDSERADIVIKSAGMEREELYQLMEDTFDIEGFLISDK